MANLGTFKIKTEYKYEKFADLTGVVLANDTTYIIQPYQAVYLVESAGVPTGEEKGFYIPAYCKTTYKKLAGSDLYINTDNYEAEVNISD